MATVNGKRLLITGASGFVGSHCLSSAVEVFDEVIATSRSPRRSSDARVNWHQIDLLEQSSAELVAKTQPTHLLHLAWETTPGTYWTSTLNEKWRDASVELIRAFNGSQYARRIVVGGTCAEYDWSSGACDESETPLSFGSPYAAAKNELHSRLKTMSLGNRLCWARLFFVFGPKEPRQKLIAYVTNQLLRHRFAKCTGDGQFRDFIYVKDAASALIQLLDSTVAGPVNIASGRAVEVRTVVETIARIIGRPELVKFEKSDDSSVETVRGDCRRLRDEVRFNPAYTLDDALLETVNWWKFECKGEFSPSNLAG